MTLTPPTLILRSTNGGPLTITQGDSNLTAIQDFLATLASVTSNLASNISAGLQASAEGTTCSYSATSLVGISAPNPAASGITLSVAGVGGLDTGAATTSTWYYLWAIYNGVSFSGLLSLSSTAPTIPAGYTSWSLVGPVYNNSSGNFTTQIQIGRTVYFQPQTNVSLSSVGSTYSSGSSTGGIVAPIATSYSGVFGGTTSSTAAFAIAGDINGTGETVCASGAVGAAIGYGTAPFYSSSTYTLPFYQSAGLPNVFCIASATSKPLQVNVSRYTF